MVWKQWLMDAQLQNHQLGISEPYSPITNNKIITNLIALILSRFV